MTCDEKIQLIMIGESNVGKTSLIRRYTKNLFNLNHLDTAGIEFNSREEKINNKIVKVKIWDTAGQEIFHSLTKNFYRKADGIIIVFDITNKESFDKIHDWIKSVHDNIETYREIQIIIVGNKIDLEEKRQVTKEEGVKLSEYFEIPYFEASAKNSIGVRTFMIKIIGDVVNNKINDRSSFNLKNYYSNIDDEKNNCIC